VKAIEQVLSLDVQPEQLTRDDQHTHRDEHDAGAELDRRVVTLEEAKRRVAVLNATAENRNGKASPAE
jgi:hypothetical protein